MGWVGLMTNDKDLSILLNARVDHHWVAKSGKQWAMIRVNDTPILACEDDA